MRNIIMLSLFLLVLCVSAFLTSCDDFFSPTVEVFINHVPEKDEPVLINRENNESN